MNGIGQNLCLHARTCTREMARFCNFHWACLGMTNILCKQSFKEDVYLAILVWVK